MTEGNCVEGVIHFPNTVSELYNVLLIGRKGGSKTEKRKRKEHYFSTLRVLKSAMALFKLLRL